MKLYIFRKPFTDEFTFSETPIFNSRLIEYSKETSYIVSIAMVAWKTGTFSTTEEFKWVNKPYKKGNKWINKKIL